MEISKKLKNEVRKAAKALKKYKATKDYKFRMRACKSARRNLVVYKQLSKRISKNMDKREAI